MWTGRWHPLPWLLRAGVWAGGAFVSICVSCRRSQSRSLGAGRMEAVLQTKWAPLHPRCFRQIFLLVPPHPSPPSHHQEQPGVSLLPAETGSWERALQCPRTHRALGEAPGHREAGCTVMTRMALGEGRTRAPLCLSLPGGHWPPFLSLGFLSVRRDMTSGAHVPLMGISHGSLAGEPSHRP